LIIVIPHLEIRACDWSKSRHVAVNISRECLRKTLLPSLIMHVSFDFSKQQLEPLD